MIHVLTIPHWRPTTSNELMKLHHMAAARRKKADANMIWAHMLEERIPTAIGRRKVEILIMQKPGRGRLLDPDAVLKSGLDALKRARVIIDDSQQWCWWTTPVIERGVDGIWGSTFTITDLDK